MNTNLHLTYLYSIANNTRPLNILSFEKPERYSVGTVNLRKQLIERNIGWTPLSFTTGLGKLGKLWDLLPELPGDASRLFATNNYRCIYAF